MSLHIKEKSVFLNQINDLINGWNDSYINNSILFLERENDLLNDFMCLESYSKNHFEILELDKFVDWNIKFQEDLLQNKKDGHNFNIFTLLKKEFDFKIKETMHSKLIKFLINPKETHGLDNIFLLEFLENIGIESPQKGSWQITAEKGNIDILIKRKNPESIIIIENKSNWATDQKNQLYRYWYKAIYLKTKQIEKKYYEDNKKKYQIIYLAPNEHKQYEQQSISKPKEDPSNIYKSLPKKIPMKVKNITFDSDIQKWLEKCKNKTPETNHRIREYISQYQMLCKNL
ncbi:PD-(D/E)XK nuclease family protein [Tenacibaculum haliotis]|uniref:PD-(D/E)XK nuclease family protein n=1 Tax=Tenacibaculum haliotis TaxID=1888914 RepID=UPI0021AFF33A|nr:PD-(D/E)XK nuclease family protein [Tenacibaculum haliotis]MCT4698218.1 PD-(D/E)XK nuclease family protein [Tenacibaculum haliotis]